MIITSCPLRISIAGGSTDLQDFIDLNGYGSVVNFACTARTYISLHENNRGKYIVNCSNHEEVDAIQDIYNDVVRVVLETFPCPPVTITFNTDIHTSGSGLASSTSYLIALLKAVIMYKGLNYSEHAICKLALELERKFNPKTGYQDPFGCGFPSLKKMTFFKDSSVDVRHLDYSMFDNFFIDLVWTGVSRSSTTQLANKKNKPAENRKVLLEHVDLVENAILQKDDKILFEVINSGWQKKKDLFPHILDNKLAADIDFMLSKNSDVLAHRLCGAGNGGYFLVFSKSKCKFDNSIAINICNRGIIGTEI